MSPGKETKISVVIPCYNCEDTIYRAVKSIMSGKKLPFEILLYDDCSIDGTHDVLQNIAKEYDLVKIFWSDINRGAGYARKFLIKNSYGDYIAFLDADDRWHSSKIDKVIEVINEKNPDIITSSYYIENELTTKIRTRVPPEKINLLKMYFSNWLPMSMTVVRSSLSGVDQMPLIRRRQDYAFWLNIFKKNARLKCHVISEPLGVYTRRKNSLSSSTLENIRFNYEMFRKVIGHNPVTSMILVLCNSIIRLFRA